MKIWTDDQRAKLLDLANRTIKDWNEESHDREDLKCRIAGMMWVVINNIERTKEALGLNDTTH